jgi:hypothetical protein
MDALAGYLGQKNRVKWWVLNGANDLKFGRAVGSLLSDVWLHSVALCGFCWEFT